MGKNDQNNRIFVSQILTVLVLVVPLILMGNSGGPDPGKTAAPGEEPNGCAQGGCHTGAGNPARDSGIEIDFAGGTTYAPGVKQRWTVRVTGAQTSRYGFQLTARPASNERSGQAGDFAPSDGRTQVICQDGRLKPCRDTAPIQYIMHTSPNNTNTFELDWTPPATDVGPIRVYAAGNAANGNGNSTGDRIFLRSFTLTPGAAAQPPSIRTAQPVLQAFMGGERMSPGTWVEIYGTNLSPATREWAVSDFQGDNAPTALDGVRVNIDNKPAFVRYISPTQINVQVGDIGTGPVQVEVVNAAGSSRATVTSARVSPALLTTPNFNVGGRQYVAALHTDFRTFVGRENLIPGVSFRPAKPGETIIVFAVGCGPTNPASPPGQIVRGLRTLTSPLQVRFGQTAAAAQGFMTPDVVGLCQLNVTVPNVAAGDHTLEATIDGVGNGQNLSVTVQP
jgi:uncharacterized protein (TIGR03437 family)